MGFTTHSGSAVLDSESGGLGNWLVYLSYCNQPLRCVISAVKTLDDSVE